MTGLAVVAAVGALAGLAGVVAAVGDPIAWASSQVRGGECENDPGRLTDLCANNRLGGGTRRSRSPATGLGGTGAGTYAIARRQVRDDGTPGSEPHSVRSSSSPTLASSAWASLVLRPLRSSRCAAGSASLWGPSVRVAAALACLALAYAVHSLVDYDLDFLAVTAPALVALGALLAVKCPPGSVRAGVPGMVAVVAVRRHGVARARPPRPR